MKIAESAAQSDLGMDTIRFYEREGLLDPVARGTDGHRRFSPRDLRWLRLFERLRSTGMPLNEMKRYAVLSRAGDSTFAARRERLERHRARPDDRQSQIDACRALIDEKITTYRTLESQKG